jgi:DNA-binding beta-propeller fold protein YncE
MQALIKPMSVVALSPDSFFVADQGAGCIYEISGNRFGIPGNLRKKFTDMSSLVGMCITRKNEILFTDSRLGSIYKISSDRKSLLKLNDSLKLKQPTGIAWSGTNNEIWVVETAEHRIKVLDSNGNILKTIGIRGTGPGEFNFPTFIWIDHGGRAYVVDAMNFRIQIFSSNGEYISSFGQAGDGSGYLARPKGIATDSYGNIYVVDALFHNVQIFNMNGDFLYQFGRQGKGQEEFWMPGGIFIDHQNFIYVADSYNSRIQVFKLVNKQ